MATTFPISPPEIRTFDREQDESMTPVSRAHDASRLSVPIQMAFAIAGTAVVMGGVFWQATGGMERRLDVLLSKMDAATELQRVREDHTQSQLEAVRDEQKSQRGKQDLLQIQLQNIQLELASLKGRR